MISHTKKCLFVHIPKTAGTSIEKLLQGDNYTEGWSSHNKLYEYENENGYDSYYKFTFVRNPWERILSVYNYYREGGNEKDLFRNPKKIINFAIKKLTTKKVLDFEISKKLPKDFDAFCDFFIKNKQDFFGRNVLDSQLSFIQINNEIAVDFIGKFESINHDIEVIKTKLNISFDLEHKRKTLKKCHYSNYYNDFTKKIIADAFAEEIDFFEYKFENQNKESWL